MAGLRRFPKLTSSYVHTKGDEASHKEEEAAIKGRPSSAPSSTQAGRNLLTAKKPSKPYYKVIYPLRNRRKTSIENQTTNAAPNAEYIVNGRGYTFTRHNNKLTMNIDTEVFFDDKTPTTNPVSITAVSRKKPTTSAQSSLKQSARALHTTLQKQLDESLQVQEKLHKALIEASVELEEQKLEQQNQEASMTEQHKMVIQEMSRVYEVEKKKLIEAHEETTFKLETLHASKLADQQAAAINRELLLREEIQRKEKILKQTNLRHETELINNVKQKEEELNSIHMQTLSSLRVEMTDDFKRQHSTHTRELEKQHAHVLADKTTKHKKEIEELLSRFKNSAQVEEDFKKASSLLKSAEDELEHLNEEKRTLTLQLRSCRAKLQETVDELNCYKQKFQSKVDNVKEQFENTINHLMTENMDIRRMLLRKTEELSNLRMEEDKRLIKTQHNIKKSVIQARIKGNRPVSLGLHEAHNDTELRQGSAPITKKEKDSYDGHITTMEQEDL